MVAVKKLFDQSRCTKWLWPLTVGAMIFQPFPGAPAAENLPFSLSFSGTPGVKFAANCMLTTADGPVQMALADFVPRQFSYSGQGLECEISRMGTKGRLTVEISKGGHTVSRASVAGGEGTLRIAVR